MQFTDEERYILAGWFGYRDMTYMTDGMIKQAVQDISDGGGDGLWVLGAAINHLLHKRGKVYHPPE